MRSTTLWLKRNAAVPVFMVLVSAAAAALFQAQEVDAHSYRILQNMLKEGSQPFSSALAQATSSGRVSRWDYQGLLQLYWSERASLKVDFDATDVGSERRELLSAVAEMQTLN